MKRVAVSMTVAVLLMALATVDARDCNIMLQGVYEVKFVAWSELEPCLAETHDGNLSRNVTENMWRLTKTAFDGVEHIPAETFHQLGLVLVVITVDELRNISMDQVETVEAFGSIRSSRSGQPQKGFSVEQLTLIAQKVRAEWPGKSPSALSEYDLRSLGEILCHFNASDIAGIHPDAYRRAAYWIGRIANCPVDRLQALAKLAVSDDAFGAPQNWSGIAVNVVGNVVNGLSASDISAIDEDKLRLNRFYTQPDGSRQQRKHNTTRTGIGTDTATGTGSANGIVPDERRPNTTNKIGHNDVIKQQLVY